MKTQNDEYLSPEIESSLSRLLEMEIIYHLRLEQLKLDLEEIEDYNIKRLFKMVDSQRLRYLDYGSIKSFLMRMGHIVQPKEVSCIIRRLDIDGDNRISFDEFVEAISAVAQGDDGNGGGAAPSSFRQSDQYLNKVENRSKDSQSQ